VIDQLAVVPYAEVRIRIGERIGAGLQRVALTQFDRAVTGLSGHDLGEGVHTARKALKRLRALLALARGPLGKQGTRGSDVVLRDVGRKMAQARDADVLIETLDALLESGEVDGAALLRSELVAGRDAAFMRSVGLPEVRATLLKELERARNGWANGAVGAALEGMDDAGVEDGLRRTYRRGRRRMERALGGGSEIDFHEWRKAVKAVRYQLETLSTAWPEVIGGMAETADDLGETLGTEHDLAVLGEVVEERIGSTTETTGSHLLDLVGAARRRLQADARPLGARVYAEEPDAFVRRIGAYWVAHRRVTVPSIERARR
jgi:CHAD domain-containing protein